ncbi:MAG: DUF4214 domain-containing protein [Glaciimonas sp.]|nr:DUF4214 domain-containing protein [Glaciimonas sp.]
MANSTTQLQQDQITQLYVSLFNRAPDAGGLSYWVQNYASGQSLANIAQSFYLSPEGQATYNGALTNTQFINAFYVNFLGRANPDAGGVAYWVGRLGQTGTTQGAIVAEIIKNVANYVGTDPIVLASKAIIDAKVLVGEYYALTVNGNDVAVAKNIMVGVVDPTTAAAAIANQGTANITLTTGLDNVTANQIFASETYFNVDGKGPTLNTGDVLKGTVGRTDNTLTITDLTAAIGTANANIPAGVTLTNIQNVVLNTSNNTSTGTGFSTVGYADVRNLTVTTNGDLADLVTAKNGLNGAVVNVSHNGFAVAAGTLNVVGGTDVTATSVGGTITVGTPTQAVRVPLATEVATGAVVVNQNGTGAGAVRVFGGASVNVTTSSTSNAGAIDIGNTANNTGNTVSGIIANTTGNITVNTNGTGAVTVSGGKDVAVTDKALSGAGAITVGDITRIDASNLPTGNVTITEAARVVYNGLAGSSNNNVVSGAIGVSGGTGVTIVTNAANAINIGSVGNGVKENTLNPTGAISVTNTGVETAAAAGAVAITGGTTVTVSTTGASVTIGRTANAGVIDQVSNPTGNVTVTETMNGNGFARAIVINNGNTDVSSVGTVTVNAKGQNVTIGNGVKSAANGAVVVNQADMLTGNGAYLAVTNAGDVVVNGGSTVTVNTTGGNVAVGAVIGGVNTVPSGAVAITRTFSGPGADTTAVQGGTTVGITTTKTSGAITVGANSAVLNPAGTALKDANLAPTGDVTIVDATTVGAATAYGTGAINVNTNGAATVSIKGGDVVAIADIQSTLATGGSGAGSAVGVSKLATVVIDGLQAANGLTIASDALTALSLLNTKGGANTVTITNNAAAHALTITEGGNNKAVWVDGAAVTNDVTVVDAKAGAITITDNGTASSAILRVDAALATAATINNAAAATVTLGGVSTNIATVTLKGAGATTFAATDVFGTGNLSKALTVDASLASGNVTASMQATTTAATAQKYLGGSGVDTLTINSNASGWGNLVAVDGGTGTADVLVANYNASGTDVALGNAASVKGFEILRLGAAASSGGNYDASGFAEVQVAAVTGSVAVTNAASSVTLSVTANTATANADNFTVTTTGANTTATNNAMTVNLGTAGASAASAGAVIIANGGGVKGTGIITDNGIEALTVKAVGGYTSAVLATSANVATINDAATAGAATLAITGTASLALTSNTGFTSINASGSTGQVIDVTAATVSNVGTTFTGGTAALKAIGSNDASNFKALVTLTGTATNNFLNTETAVVTINGATYTYTSIGTNTAATVAGLLAAAITADGTVNNALGNVVKGGAGSPAVTAVASGGSIVLTKNAAFEVGTSETGTNATIADAIVGGQQQIVLESATAITGAGNGNIVVTFAGGAGAITVAVANSDTTAMIATKVAAGITLAVAANKPGIASAVVVDTTKVLVTMQSGEISQVAITTTATFAGAGVAATDSTNFATVDNSFVTGLGGGTYKAGLGGSWNVVSHKFSSGSETVNLTASAAKTDTLQLKEGATITDNSVKGGVTKFVVGSQAASDVVTFRNAADNGNQAKVILANAATGTVNTVTTAAGMAAVLDSSGALNAKLANLTYVISNGVITFGATGGHNLSEFTTGELISAAEILVSSTTTGGANKVAAFSYNGRSYVVSSDNGNTLAAGVDNKSVIVELKDVASVKGFGSTFGEATVVATNVTNITGAAVDIAALAVSSTLDYTGFAKATLAVAGTAAANTNVTKFTNLASSAELALGNTNAGGTHLGLLETTQVGTSGSNSLTVSTATQTTIVDKLTVSGDAQLYIAPGVVTTLTELVDATNTLNTITVLAGANALTILKETGTALTTVDASLAGGTFVFGNGVFFTTTNYTVNAADAHSALTVKLAGGQNSLAWLSGSNDIITQAIDTTAATEAAAVGNGVVILVASGGANNITLGNGSNSIVANGASDVITVGTGSNTIVATGGSDVFNIGSGAGTTKVTVGTGATLNIGTVNTANAGAETIVVTSAVTGGTTAGYAQTVLNFVSGSTITGNIIDFSTTADAFTLLGANAAASQINVSGAATLANALDMAANFTLLTQVQGATVATANLAANTAKIDWFQFGGDTYVVAMVNSTGAGVQQTGLDANDIVVKITGMVNLTGSAFNAGTEQFTL